MTAPHADRRDLRPGLRHLRLPGRRGRVRPRRTIPSACPRRDSSASTSTTSMFHGYDFDTTMLRIGSMNMLLHGVETPDIRYRDSLAAGRTRAMPRRYTLILANPPFAGILDYETTAKDLQRDRQDEEDRAAVPRAVPAAAQARRPGGGHRAGRRAVRLVQGAQGAAPDAGRGPEARRRREAAVRRVQALRRRLDRDPVLHQDQLRRHGPRLVLRRAGRRLEPRRQAAAAAAPRTSSARCRGRR